MVLKNFKSSASKLRRDELAKDKVAKGPVGDDQGHRASIR